MLQIHHHRHSFSCYFLGSSLFHAHVLCMWLTAGCYLMGTIVYWLQELSCRAGFSALLTPLPEMLYGCFPAALPRVQRLPCVPAASCRRGSWLCFQSLTNLLQGSASPSPENTAVESESLKIVVDLCL